MKKYTKLCLATLCFISSASAFADGYKGEAPPLVPVSIPSFAGGFEFTLGALYMTPDSSNLDYLAVHSLGWSDVNRSNVVYDVNPGYNWGFVLGLGYVIPNTSNDVKLDWMYFHNNFKSSEFIVGGDAETVAFVPGFLLDLSGDPGDLLTTLHAIGQVKYDFDAVDLTVGQYLNFGSRLQTRLFTGLRYMRLDDDLSTNYAVLNTRGVNNRTNPSNYFVDGSVDSSFNGLGPMVGIKADYYLGKGFSLTGGIDAALLVGELSLNASSRVAQFTQSGPTAPFALVDAENVDYSFDSQQVIAPGFDAKFGFSYKYQFNNGTLLGIELGYQVTKYIDVVEQIDAAEALILDSAPGTLMQPLQGFDHKDTDVTNFRLAGPYLTANVKI